MVGLSLNDFSNGGIYHWIIASFGGSLTGDLASGNYIFIPINFAFSPTGTFSLSQSGGNLVLNYQGASVQYVWVGSSDGLVHRQQLETPGRCRPGEIGRSLTRRRPSSRRSSARAPPVAWTSAPAAGTSPAAAPTSRWLPAA